MPRGRSRPPPRPSPFGEFLRTVRRESGLTQTKLAAEAGIHQVTLANLETGRRSPDTDTAYKLLEALSRHLPVLGPPEKARQHLLARMTSILLLQRSFEDQWSSSAALVKDFQRSPWAQTLEPPPTPSELAMVVELIPNFAKATIKTAYHVLLALRSTEGWVP